MGETGFFLKLEEVSAIVERFEEPTLSNILKEVKPTPEMAFLINLEALCERYSKSPEEILEWDSYYLTAFHSILRGKSNGMKSKGDMNMTQKQLKKGFR